MSAPVTVRGALASVGEIVRFSGSVIRELPHARKYASEAAHQAGVMILTSGLDRDPLPVHHRAAIMYLAEYFVTVVNLGGVSSGGYLYIFWLYQTPGDFLYAQLKVMAMGTVIVLVGCFHGFTAHGGPVGVGKATARSMMINMVLIHIIGVLGTQPFWGLSPNAPVAN